MRVFRKKFPPLREILGLYATIVCLVYSWTSIAFFWKVPSWLYFLTLGEIAVVLSYLLVSSLLEATIILFIFLLASLTLPSRWLSDKFLVRGSVIIYSLTFWVALFDLSSLIELPSSSIVISFMIGMPLTCALAIMLVDRISLVHQAITSLGDRLTIFLYVCLPLSLIGIFVIILRIL